MVTGTSLSILYDGQKLTTRPHKVSTSKTANVLENWKIDSLQFINISDHFIDVRSTYKRLKPLITGIVKDTNIHLETCVSYADFSNNIEIDSIEAFHNEF